MPNLNKQRSKIGRKKLENRRGLPLFISQVLNKAKGTGPFSLPELLVTLFFVIKNFHKVNAYALTSSEMGNARSRGSIRRKVENIISKETGTKDSGLMVQHKRKDRKFYKKVLVSQFWRWWKLQKPKTNTNLRENSLRN